MPPEPILVAGPLGRTLGRMRVVAAASALQALGAQWQAELDRLVSHWPAEVSAAQRASGERQIEAAVQQQHPAALSELTVPVLGVDMLLAAMDVMAAAGVDAVLAEAHAAGVPLQAPPPLNSISLATWAQVAAEALASGLAATMAREALRLFRPGQAAADVVAGVRTFLDGLTDRPLRDALGGALTKAQNLGRLAAYGMTPPQWELRLYADETLDSNTCEPCRKIDGQLLPSFDAAMVAYGGAGYLWCKGGDRCRGTMRGEWIQRRGEDRVAALVSVSASSKIDAILSNQQPTPPERGAGQKREEGPVHVDLNKIHNLAETARERMAGQVATSPRWPYGAASARRDLLGRSWYQIENRAATAEEPAGADIYLFDMIGDWGVTAQDFVNDLRAVKAGAITLHLNSEGGEVFDGLAIYESLRRHPANVTAVVEGLAASSASFIAMAADKIIMSPRGRMMIHDAHGVVIGNARDMTQMATLLDELSNTIADIYASRAGGTRASWRAAMAAGEGGPDGTWYDAQAAVDAGLADEITGAAPAKGGAGARAGLPAGPRTEPIVPPRGNPAEAPVWSSAAFLGAIREIEAPPPPPIPDGRALRSLFDLR